MALARIIALLVALTLSASAARGEGIGEMLRHIVNGDDLAEARLYVTASSSLNRLDRDSARLMRAMELTSASTLGQALSVFGIRQAIDMDRPFVAVTDANEGIARSLFIIATRNGDRFETDLRCEMLEPETGTLRFEFGGMMMVARRLDENTIAVATEYGAMKRLLRDEPRDGAWHAGIPGAGMDALEEAPLAFLGEDLIGWMASVNLGLGPFDAMMDGAGAVTVTPGPLGLRIDAYIKDGGEGGGDAEPDGIPVVREQTPLGTLRRDGAFIAGQVLTGHPTIQRAMERIAAQRNGSGDAMPGEFVRAALPVERIAWTTRIPGGSALLDVTGLEMLEGTTIHWTSPDPQGDVDRTRAAIEALVERGDANKGRNSARFDYDADGLAAADRTLASWSLLLANGRLGGMDLSSLNDAMLSLFPSRSGGLTLRGDLSWRGPLGSATFMRDAEVAVVDHRACPPAESFDGDPIVNQVRAFLPERRIAEVYVDLRILLEGIMPVLAESGQAFPLPTVVPPCGAALEVAEDHYHGGVFVPAIGLRPIAGLTMEWLRETAIGRQVMEEPASP